jgi:hypothetical protein
MAHVAIELHGMVRGTSDGLMFTGVNLFGGKEYPFEGLRLEDVIQPQLPSGRNFKLVIELVD